MSKYESLVVTVVAQIRRNVYTESLTNCFLRWIPPRVRISYGAYSEAMHNDQSEAARQCESQLFSASSQIKNESIHAFFYI